MYQIFESNLYYQRIILEHNSYINELSKNDIPDDEELPVDDIPDNEEELSTNDEGLPVDEIPSNTTNEDPLSTGEEQQLSPEEIEKNNFQAIQKFILYHKLRELQYRLDDVKTINLYKNKEDLIKFNKFLSYVITFFSIFDFKQASKLTERILTEFKKIK